MFREMNRKKQQLTDQDCVDILKSELRGVLSVNGDDGYPYGLPINHYYCEADGKIYFHSGMKGHKVDAISRSDKVSYCVYDSGFRREGEWALNIRSVIVFGRLQVVEDVELADRMIRKLSEKFTDDRFYIDAEIQRLMNTTLFFRLVPEHLSGKLVNES